MRWVFASVAAIIVAVTLGSPFGPAHASTGAPSTAVVWREPGDRVSVAVSASGRMYTAATIYREGRVVTVVRALRPDGSLVWARTWAPAHAAVGAWDVAIGPKDSVIVAGAINHASGPGACDEIWDWGWAIRMWGASGSVRWQRTQPGWRSCDVFGTSARAVGASTTGIAIAVDSGSEYSSEGRVVTFDLEGRQRWETTIDPRGSVNEYLSDIAIADGGAVYVAGSRNVGAFEEPERDADAMLVKLASSGSVRWMRHTPDRGPAEDLDRGTAVTVDPNGIVFAAVLGNATRLDHARIARYTPSGTVRWARSIHWVAGRRWIHAFVRTAGDVSMVATVARNADGLGTYIAVRGYGSTGDLLWRRSLGAGPDRAWGPTTMDANGARIVVAGRPALATIWTRVWLLTFDNEAG